MDRVSQIEGTLARIDQGLARLLHLGEEARQEWLSISQAAAVTGLSTSHVRRAVRSGQLTASNTGTRDRPVWRIARRDLDAWMRRRVGGTGILPTAAKITVNKKSRHFDD